MAAFIKRHSMIQSYWTLRTYKEAIVDVSSDSASVDVLINYQKELRGLAADLVDRPYDARAHHALNELNAMIALNNTHPTIAHPGSRSGYQLGGRYALWSPGVPSAFTTVGEVLLSFANALVGGAMGVCQYQKCGKIFALNQRQIISKFRRKQKTYCSKECRLKHKESDPRRRRRAKLRMRRLRKQRREGGQGNEKTSGTR